MPAVVAANELRTAGKAPPTDGGARGVSERESLKAVARPKPRAASGTLGDKREQLEAVSPRVAEGGARSSAGRPSE